MTLLIQQSVKNEKERKAVIKDLEENGWAVNLENIEDDSDYQQVEYATNRNLRKER